MIFTKVQSPMEKHKVHVPLRSLPTGIIIRVEMFAAAPYTTRTTMTKIEELGGIELLAHPAYSPDVASSDYYLLRFMAWKKFLKH